MEETSLQKIRQIREDEPEYPEKLHNYPRMPKELYVLGTLPEQQKPSIAIVGARMCSVYGRIQAFRYAKYLSEAGVQVISGLASGIDAEGHKGALEGGTATYAVMGNGVDICYPSGNRRLYERILRSKGGILSEYPPGTHAQSYHFPIRNRIISALADVVLVVEAKEKSGSLITARYAMEQGKSVYAVPGPVNESLSSGCHKLIYDGAGIAYSPEILLSEWGIGVRELQKEKEKKKITLASELKLVYSGLGLRPKTVDDLVRETGLLPEKIRSGLLELELMGVVRETGRNYYIKQENINME